jgi:glycosyltransferase involved in cell wall biosynthesis
VTDEAWSSMSEQALRSDLRVLLVVDQLRRAVPGGIGTYAQGLIRGLTQVEPGQCRPSEITLHASRASRRTIREGGSDPLARFGLETVISALPGPLLTRAWDAGVVRAPASFDVIHSVSLAAPPRRPGNGIRETRSIVTVHDLAWRHFPQATTRRGRIWHEAALRRALRTADAFVVPSQATADDLVRAGAAPDMINVVPYGADHLPPPNVPGTADLLRQLGVEGEFLLSVGTAEPRKNLDRLVIAYEAARPRLPDRWPLLIVGPSGWCKHPSTNEPPGVLQLGEVDEAILAGLYSKARLFVYVPILEGFGFPPLEAMSTKTPVVVSNTVPSVVEAPMTDVAFVVNPFDTDSIAAGLVSAATAEGQRSEFRARAMSLVRLRPWKTAATLHQEMWRSLR